MLIVGISTFYEQDKFHAQLSMKLPSIRFDLDFMLSWPGYILSEQGK